MSCRRLTSFCMICTLFFSIVFCSPSRADSSFGSPPEYLKSVTYFSDDWPINFWNSESRNMDGELARIAADGFNSIILALPWREFQPDMKNRGNYNSYAFQKLDRVMETAAAHGLWVSVRLGYTWDYYNPSEAVTDRYEALLSSPAARSAWKDYAETVYRKASAHPNFSGGFITWEDFWNFTGVLETHMDAVTSVQRAKSCGYADYLEANYSLDELSRLYGKRVKSYGEVQIPSRNQAAAKLFYDFYDDFLIRLLADTQQVFPGLSMEVRLDRELLYDEAGQPYYYGHEKTFGCGKAFHTAAMVSTAMGQANRGEKVSASSGIGAADSYLAYVRGQTGGKPLYIEQFLYMDSTPGFSHNAQIQPGQLGSYLTGMAPVLKKYSCGYGVWVYRDYGNNQLYNSQFALGMNGWFGGGGVKIVQKDGNWMAQLQSGSALRQELNGDMWDVRQPDAYVRFYASVEEPCRLTVLLGNEKQEVEVGESGIYQLEFHNVRAKEIKIQGGGKLYLDDVNVYSRVQEGRLYDINFQPLDCIGAVRTVNSILN